MRCAGAVWVVGRDGQIVGSDVGLNDQFRGGQANADCDGPFDGFAGAVVHEARCWGCRGLELSSARGGWGATPVLAHGLKRQQGVETGPGGPLAAWVRPDRLPRRPRALLSLLVGGQTWWPPSEAESRQAELSGDGRAQRGLDLFLGQNRTNRRGGDATAL